jgi:hypothetical protein
MMKTYEGKGDAHSGEKVFPITDNEDFLERQIWSK